MNQTALLFAALWVSEPWYGYFLRSGKIHAKTRAVIAFDRIITGPSIVTEQMKSCNFMGSEPESSVKFAQHNNLKDPYE